MSTNKKTIVKSERPQTKNLLRGSPVSKFDSKNQPSPEAKREGWQRKKAAQQMLVDIENKQGMTFQDFIDQYMDVKVIYKINKEIQPSGKTKKVVEEYKKYTVKDSLTIQERFNVLYVFNAISKGNVDWMNRLIPYAPTSFDFDGKIEQNGSITIKVPKK